MPCPVSARPAARNPGPTTTTTQNLTEYETLKSTFHDTANRCHRNGIRFAPVVLDGHAGELWRLRTQPGRLDVPTAQRREINLELAQRISSSLHCDYVFAILRRVRLAASRDASLLLGSDEWWDPGCDEWTSDSESHTVSDTETPAMTTTGLALRWTRPEPPRPFLLLLSCPLVHRFASEFWSFAQCGFWLGLSPFVGCHLAHVYNVDELIITCVLLV